MGKLKKLFFEDDYMAKPLRKGKTLFIFCMVIVALVNFAIFYVAVNINSIIMAFKWYDADLGYHVISWGILKLCLTICHSEWKANGCPLLLIQ